MNQAGQISFASRLTAATLLTPERASSALREMVNYGFSTFQIREWIAFAERGTYINPQVMDIARRIVG